jgi:hypothetical protein
VEEQDTWVVSNKKRKKSSEKGSVLGVKLRKSSSEAAPTTRPAPDGGPHRVHGEASSQEASHKHTDLSPPPIVAARVSSASSPAAAKATTVDSEVFETSGTKHLSSAPKPSLGLGLDDYSSDDE